MIFYHFTFLKVVEGARLFMQPGAVDENGLVTYQPAPEGLTPAPGQAWGSLDLQHKFPDAPEVVWLTADPATVAAKHYFICKCTIKLPSTDRKLINWPKWRDRNFSAQTWSLPKGVDQHWWGYAGTIPLDRIVNIELLENQLTPWYLKDYLPAAKHG